MTKLLVGIQSAQSDAQGGGGGGGTHERAS